MLKKSENPPLSIITPTFNDPEGLRKTLLSLKDLGIEYEHLIIDSSPERNVSVLSEFSNIQHLVESPLGIYPAMNSGIKRAKGDVLWFLNGGDELKDPQVFKKALKQFHSSDADFMIGGADQVRNRQFLYPWAAKKPFSRNLMGTNRICHQAVLYKRKSFLEVGLYETDYRYAADYEHHLRMLILGRKEQMTSETLVKYDLSGSSTEWKKVLPEFDRAWKKHRFHFSFPTRLKGDLKGKMEYLRISVLKTLGESRFSPWLRPIWLRYKRHF